MVSSVQLVMFFHLALPIASGTSADVNFTLLSDIVNSTSKYHQFDVVPILAAEHTLFEIEDFIIGLQQPKYILSNVRRNTEYRFNRVHETLIIVFFRGIADVVFEMTDRLTHGKRIACTIFVLTRPAMSHREIQRIMVHAWQSNYMRALMLYKDTQGQDCLVTYDVYDDFEMKSIIGSYKESDIFLVRLYGNMKRSKIRSPVKNDIPRVFEVTSAKGGKKYTGYIYRLFMAYINYMNATFEEYHMRVHEDSTNVIMTDIQQLILDGTIEIALHPFDHYNSATGIQSSQPISFNEICLMVPMAHEIPSYMYLKRPFHLSVWLLVLFATIGLSFVLMWIPANSSGSRQEFGQSLLRSVGHMLNISTWEYRHNVSWRYMFVHKAYWILGFLVTEWYCALLGSYWATTVFGPQIDTINDFLHSDLKIPLKDEDLKEFQSFQHFPVEFKKRFIPFDVDLLATYRYGFNTSYAYMISSDRWCFLNLQQQYSKRPIFRLSNICAMNNFVSYQMAYDSRLQYSLQAFILYTHQSGLLRYWMHSDFRNAAREGYVKLMMDSYNVEPVHYENLLLAFWVFEIGLGVSVVVFSIEVLLQLLQKYSKRILAHIGRVAQRVG